MSQDITIIPAPPIDTLTELRRQNSTLLQRNVAGAGTTPPSPGELLGFLSAAAKLGRSLEDYEQRETAQGIMDFWIAALLSAAPEASEGTRPFTLEPYDECIAVEHANEAQQLRVEAVQAAKRAQDLPAAQEEGAKQVKIGSLYDWVPRCLKPWVLRLSGRDSDAAVMQRLLLQFIRLKEKSTEAYCVPVPGKDDIFREPKASALVEQLCTAGVVRRQEDAYVLTHDTLLTKWGFLVDIVTQRRSFRQLARGWDNGGRQTAALLHGGEQLQQALDYPHTDELEDAFIEASRRSGEKFRAIALTLVSLALVVLCFMVWRLSVRKQELTIMNEKLQAEHKLLVLAKEGAEKAKEAALQSEALSSISKSQLYSLRDMLLNRKLLTNPADPKGNKIQELSWRGPVNEHAVRTIIGILTTIDPVPDPDRPQLEVFVPLDSTTAALEKAASHVNVLTTPQEPSHLAFQPRTHVPLPRIVVPDKADRSEIRYFYAGSGPDKKGADSKLADADPDKKLADQILQRLLKANSGMTLEKITILALPDPTAPADFIQLVFAKGSLD